MADDLYSLFMSDAPTAAELAKARSEALLGKQRQADQLGGLGRVMALHPVLQQPARQLMADSQFGQNQVQQGQEMLGRAGQFRAGQLGEEKRQGAQFANQKELAGINNAAEWARVQAQLGAKGKEDEAKKTEQTFKMETDLRNKLIDMPETKDAMKVAGYYRGVKNATPNGAGDIGLLYNYLHIVEPGSMVKDTEFVTAGKSNGLPGHVQGLFNQLTAQGMLSEGVRKQIREESRKLTESRMTGYRKIQESFKKLAPQYGADPSRVVIDLGMEDEEQPKAHGDFDLGAGGGRQVVKDKSGKVLGYINADGTEELVK